MQSVHRYKQHECRMRIGSSCVSENCLKLSPAGIGWRGIVHLVAMCKKLDAKPTEMIIEPPKWWLEHPCIPRPELLWMTLLVSRRQV